MTVLKDDEFDLPSEKAVKARLCADRQGSGKPKISTRCCLLFILKLKILLYPYKEGQVSHSQTAVLGKVLQVLFI